jgi:hypothetical protein
MNVDGADKIRHDAQHHPAEIIPWFLSRAERPTTGGSVAEW